MRLQAPLWTTRSSAVSIPHHGVGLSIQVRSDVDTQELEAADMLHLVLDH